MYEVDSASSDASENIFKSFSANTLGLTLPTNDKFETATGAANASNLDLELRNIRSTTAYKTVKLTNDVFFLNRIDGSADDGDVYFGSSGRANAQVYKNTSAVNYMQFASYNGESNQTFSGTFTLFGRVR